MSTSAGTKITTTTMTTLANLANSKTQLTSSVPNGNASFNLITSYYYNNSGSGYIVGDIVQDPYQNNYVVVATNITGSVIGIKPMTIPLGYPQFNYPTLMPFINGSGVNLTMSFQYGPTIYDNGSSSPPPTNVPYSFSPYTASVGTFTQLNVLDGGIGYTTGSNNLYVPNLFTTCSIASTSAAGVISAITTGSFNHVTIPTNYNLLTPSASNGTGSILNGNFVLNANPAWLTELNRLRNNLYATLTNIGTPTLKTCVSGPWPVSLPEDNWSNTTFYYSTQYGNNVPITCSSQLITLNYCQYTTYQFLQGNGSAFPYPGWAYTTQSYCDTYTFGFVLGGTGSVLVSGSIWCDAEIDASGSYYYPNGSLFESGDDYSGDVSIQSTNIPYSHFSTYTVAGAAIEAKIDINTMLSPGIYTCTLKSNSSKTNDTNTTLTQSIQTRVHYDSRTAGAETNLQSIAYYASSSQVPAINNAYPVNGIKVSFDPTTLLGSVLGSYTNVAANDPFDYPYPTPLFLSSSIDIQMATVHWTTCPGLWSSLTQPIGNLNPVPYSQMPWDVSLYYSAGGILYQYNPMLTQSAITTNANQAYGLSTSNIIETANELQTWQPTTYYRQGFVISDHAYNLQKCRNTFTSTTSYPTMAATVGGLSSDNNWQCIQAFTLPTQSWQPNHYYSLGSTIVDDVGCTRTNVRWSLSQSFGGTSSAVSPFTAFETTLNAANNRPYLIADNGVNYTYLQSLSFTGSNVTPLWALTNVSASRQVIPATHRITGLPAYPCYKYGETNSYLMPPAMGSGSTTIFGTDDQWHNSTAPVGPAPVGWSYNNVMYGNFIYSVSINRIGSNYTNNILLPTIDISGSVQQISCSIGCMRSGSFASFGNFVTGQTYQVLWPIFTSDALVYQASERIDVQAVAIEYPSEGWTINNNYPMCAAYIDDTTKCLSLLS